jgi:hypothetical protein
MTIQSLPTFFNMKFTDKDGKLSSDAYLYLDQQFQALNNLMIMFNNSVSTIFANTPSLQTAGIMAAAVLGINPPSFTTAQIDAIVALNPAPPGIPIIPLGTIWYNSTLSKLQFLSPSGIIETITSTP